MNTCKSKVKSVVTVFASKLKDKGDLGHTEKTHGTILKYFATIIKFDLLSFIGDNIKCLIYIHSCNICSLSWPKQVTSVCQKVTCSLRILYRLKNFLLMKTKVMLVQTIKFPIINYGNVLL